MKVESIYQLLPHLVQIVLAQLLVLLETMEMQLTESARLAIVSVVLASVQQIHNVSAALQAPSSTVHSV